MQRAALLANAVMVFAQPVKERENIPQITNSPFDHCSAALVPKNVNELLFNVIALELQVVYSRDLLDEIIFVTQTYGNK